LPLPYGTLEKLTHIAGFHLHNTNTPWQATSEDNIDCFISKKGDCLPKM
jgi:hypothetical protein